MSIRSRIAVAAVAMGATLACARAQGQPERVALVGQVVTWDGRPVAGAAVAFDDPLRATTAELLEQAAVRTDANGAFELAAEAVAPDDQASYQLLIASPGHASVARPVPWKLVDGTPRPGARAVRAARTDLGRIVLPDGVRLFGRVRGRDGAPLPGARIVARDLLDDVRVLPGVRPGCLCVAASDARGIFELPTTLPQGVTLDVRRDGCYRRTIEPVAVGTPLEIELAPSGTIQGRVLDAEGRGVEGAKVVATYERRGPCETATTARGGSFVLPLERPARYRLTATLAARDADGKPKRAAQARSAVLDGPRANLELTMKPPEDEAADASDQRMRVRAVAAATNAAVPAFRVGAVWEDYANQNANYLEYRMQWMLQPLRTAEDGVLEINGPGRNNARVGIVRVLAPGFAPATVRDVEWKDLDEGTERELLTVSLQPQATIAGKVVDERTGQPIAGVKVWARPQLDASLGSYGDRYGGSPPPDAVETGADGSFALDQLGEGSWHLRCHHPQRPTMPPEGVELKAAEQRTDLVLRLPAGADVRGRITGMPVTQGTRIFLHELQQVTFGNSGVYTSYRSGIAIPDTAQELAADGTFAFTGVKLENFLLVLVLPSRPRCGDPLCIPLEPFRVRRAGIEREFDASEDRPGTIAGRVVLPGASVPWTHLAVVAQQVADDPNLQVNSNQFGGPRSFVAPDATFAIDVAPGNYRLQLVDFATGLPLAFVPKPFRVLPSQRVETELSAALTEVVVKLEPEVAAGPVAAVDRLEVRFQPKNGPRRGFGNDNYDSGTGIPIEPGQAEVRLQLPPGNATFLLRNNVAQLRVDQNRHNQPPFGRQDLEVTADAASPLDCTIKVGAPAEIVDPDAKPRQDEDGDGKR